MPIVETFAKLAKQVIGLPPSAGSTRVVAVDGRAGAGKTTFTARLEAALDALPATCAVVRTDDLSSHADFFGWWPTLVADALEPLRDGRPGSHGVYDWEARRALSTFWAEWLRREATYQAAERTWERADLLVDGNPAIPHDPEREYVRLM